MTRSGQADDPFGPPPCPTPVPELLVRPAVVRPLTDLALVAVLVLAPLATAPTLRATTTATAIVGPAPVTRVRGVTGLRRHVDVAGLQEIGLNAQRRFLGARGPWLASLRRLGRELPGSGRPVKKSCASVVHLRHPPRACPGRSPR